MVLVGCGASTPPAPVLRVEAVGSAPQLLRFAPRPHVPEHFELVFKQRSRIKTTNTVLEESERLIDLPTVKLIGTLEATRVDATGADIELVVADVRVLDDVVDPDVRTRLAAAIPKLVGTRATWHRAPNGVESHHSVTEQTGVLDLDDMLPNSWRLPDEPIGVGAKWHTVGVTGGKIAWQRTASYELVALENRVATLHVHVEMRAESQAMSVEPGATSRLRGGTATAEIEVRVPLDRLVVDGNGIAMTTLDANVTRRDLRIMTSTTIEEFHGMKPCTAASVEACGH